MAKKVFYDEDARRRVLAGAEILYNAVKTTMGPKGRNVIIDKSYGNPTVTHDGVTVAKGVEIEDKDDETLGYKVGAELIKEAANKLPEPAVSGEIRKVEFDEMWYFVGSKKTINGSSRW